ncbi:MAG TPA: hypothetical protein VF796_01335, partial [Humisphaera sp.]
MRSCVTAYRAATERAAADKQQPGAANGGPANGAPNGAVAGTGPTASKDQAMAYGSNNSGGLGGSGGLGSGGVPATIIGTTTALARGGLAGGG